jgi:2-polyprenyl-3-methyl-5-hydroxy-6-metoxy-1,4-benzoquinol methylase
MTLTLLDRPAAFDTAKADDFGTRMLGLLNDGALSLMISIGHRTRLFDVMSGMRWATSDAIADATRLDRRYVREWLGAMVTGGIVDHDPRSGEYRLPREHALSLTRTGTTANLAVAAQFVPLLGGVEDQIVRCFQEGGGVPYAAFPRFHEVMSEQSAQTVISALESGILPLAPGLLDALEDGIDVLDVGCGSGRTLAYLAALFPASRFTGVDFSVEAIETARDEAIELELHNVRFEMSDAALLAARERWDLITAFDAIHDQADPARVLRNIARALRPDGVFLMQDISGTSHLHRDMDHPVGPLLYTVSCLHCMTVSLAQGGAGLGAMWGEELAQRMLREAGFGNFVLHRLPHDVVNTYYVCRRD